MMVEKMERLQSMTEFQKVNIDINIVDSTMFSLSVVSDLISNQQRIQEKNVSAVAGKNKFEAFLSSIFFLFCSQ